MSPHSQQRDPLLYIRVMENIDRAVLALDRNEQIILFNTAAQDLTAISERQALGRRFSELFHGQEGLLSLARAALIEGRSVSDQENILLRRPIGPPLPVNASALPLFSDAGVQDGAVVILRDLSRIRELEDAVRRNDQLAIAGTMATGLAHEIKNPLGGIRGAAQLLDLELDERPELREYTGVMIREIDRISGLIEELMDLAAPREPQFGQVQLTALLNDIVLLQREAHRERGIEFHLDVDPSIPALIGDATLLARLFLNLIKNAAEAIVQAPGQVTIHCRVGTSFQMQRPGSRATQMVQVEVRDNGRGIPLEELEQIFTPFHTTKETGTGLGLTMCQKIVHDHQGLIRLDSELGSGTTVTVSLPLLQKLHDSRPKTHQEDK